MALFAPPPPHDRAYRAYVTREPLANVLSRITTDAALLRPAGSWQPRPLIALEAFGQSGRYDRSALARLYGARRPVVARGPRRLPSGQWEMWTLISPYPDEELQALNPGTLLFVLRVP